MIQIMSIWDASDADFEKLMHAAMVELLVDPLGLVRVAPGYFDLLCDVAAWTGDRERLEQLYKTADVSSHSLPDEQLENRSVLDHDPAIRPETHADLRRILSNGSTGDPRGNLPELNEAAGLHNDERSWRLIAWYYLKTGDEDGLVQLLERTQIEKGPWHTLFHAIEIEKTGDLELALAQYKAAQKGTLANTALLNQARLLLRLGQVEKAAGLAAAARQGIEVRSIGLVHEPGSPYAFLYADALALQSRILRAQGRESEAQSLLRSLSLVNPDHPELYNAKGLEIKPEIPLENHL